MNAEALREFAASLIDMFARKDDDSVRLNDENRLEQYWIDQLIHEMAVLRRWKFGGRSEQLSGEQKVLIDETFDADLAAIEPDLNALRGTIEGPIRRRRRSGHRCRRIYCAAISATSPSRRLAAAVAR